MVVLEHFGMKLVNLVPNYITMLSVFVYLSVAYLGIILDMYLFKYYYGMGKLRGIVSSCAIQLHEGSRGSTSPCSPDRRAQDGGKDGSTALRPRTTVSSSWAKLGRRTSHGTRLQAT